MSAQKNQLLENLFLDALAEMYVGEQQVAKSFSSLSKLATNEELKRILLAQAYQSVRHVSSVAEIFGSFGTTSRGVKNNSLTSLVADAEALAAATEASPAQEAAILTLLLKVTHFQIATYNYLRDWAGILENRGATNLLDSLLHEEWASENSLTQLTHQSHLEELQHTKWEGHRDGVQEQVLEYQRYGISV